MNYCRRCGVELDVDMDRCPLCGLAVGEEPLVANSAEAAPLRVERVLADSINTLTGQQKRRLFLKLSGIILFSGALATLVINFVINHEITWAKFVLIAALSVFANLSLFICWYKNYFGLIIGNLLVTVSAFWLMEVVDKNIDWGTGMAIPILVSLYGLIIIVWRLIKVSHQKGFNILAIIFLAAGLFTICIESVVSLYIDDMFFLSWSIVVLGAVLPVSALLFYVHYKLKTGIELRRFFHI